MLIAHAPAGYIVLRTYNKAKNKSISFMKYGLIFSLWPDLDLIYFYLIDRRSTFHHLYFTHLPIVLLVCMLLVIPLRHNKTFNKIKDYYYLLLANWFVHILLDTFTGGIPWIYPLSSKVFTLITVPAAYPHWLLSFFLHWSFLIEVAIVYAALWLAARRNAL